MLHRLQALIDRDRQFNELLLVLPRDTRCVRSRGWLFHLYGIDICLQVCARGLPTVVLDALCVHNSRPEALLVVTPCAMIGPGT